MTPGPAARGATGSSVLTATVCDRAARRVASAERANELGGPLRIAQLSGQVAQQGLIYLIQFIALLSVNLGLINLFPIPVLDCGHLLFYLAEAIRGRPIPPRAQEYGFRAGLALIAFMAGTTVGALIMGRLIVRLTHYMRIPIIGLLLAITGLAETVFHYRAAGRPPETPN